MVKREWNIKGVPAGVASVKIAIAGNCHADSILLAGGLLVEYLDSDEMKVETRESCYIFGALLKVEVVVQMRENSDLRVPWSLTQSHGIRLQNKYFKVVG